MSPDSCLSIHMYLRNLCRVHVSGSVYKHPYVSQDPLQDPCLRFMSQHLYISGSSARSMSPDSWLMSSGSLLSIFVSQDSLQDPCLRIHVSASLYLRILCKIHVSDSCRSIHQNGSSTRSTSSDSCLSIFVSHGFSARPMSPDPCRSIHFYLTILCKIHVSGLMSQHLCIPGPTARSMSPDPRSAWAFRAGETQILTSGDAFCVALRRENNPIECFAQAKRKFWPAETHFLWPCAGETQFWPPETRLVSISGGITRNHDQMNENRHGATARRQKFSQPPFGAGETQILTSGVAFFVALRSEKRGGQKFAPRPKRL